MGPGFSEVPSTVDNSATVKMPVYAYNFLNVHEGPTPVQYPTISKYMINIYTGVIKVNPQSLGGLQIKRIADYDRTLRSLSRFGDFAS